MRRRFIMASVATILIGLAGYVANITTTVTVYSSEKHAEKQVIPSPTPKPLPVQTETPAPRSEKQVVINPQPTVKLEPPVIKGNNLSISSIGFQGSIVDVGVTAANAIDVPANHVGRWVGSSTPGTPGAVFLDGHVDGVFARLNKVAVGQIISVVYNGQTFNYKVVFSEVVNLATIDMSRSLSVYGGATEGLNIMTCAGTYIPSIGTFDKRLVVYGVRIA